MKKKKYSYRKDYERLEQVIGCKWSVSVIQTIEDGVHRPGAIEREIEGISTKVLSERLRRLSQYGLIEKKIFAEVPPRTEYSLTDTGKALSKIISQIHSLDPLNEG